MRKVVKAKVMPGALILRFNLFTKVMFAFLALCLFYLVETSADAERRAFSRVLELDGFFPQNYYRSLNIGFGDCIKECFSEDKCVTFSFGNGNCWFYSRETVKSEPGTDLGQVRSYSKQGLCSPNYSPVATKCLRILGSPANQTEARIHCQNDGASLLMYKDIDFVQDLKAFWKNSGYPASYYWVDAHYNTTHWLWADGEVIGDEFFDSTGPATWDGPTCIRLFISDSVYTYLVVGHCYDAYMMFCEKPTLN